MVEGVAIGYVVGERQVPLPHFSVLTACGRLRDATPGEVEAMEYGQAAYFEGYGVAQLRDGAWTAGHDVRWAVAAFVVAEFWDRYVENREPFPVEAGACGPDDPGFQRLLAWWDRVAEVGAAAMPYLRERMAEVIGVHDGIFHDAEGNA